MKVVVCHNFYQRPGGEDQVFADETGLLENRGDTVIRYTLHNDAVANEGKLALAKKTFWNAAIYRELRNLVEREKPEVVHFHNTFPLMSTAAYSAARDGGAAVVQTLHNYRLFCPNGMFFRDGHVCEDCLGKWSPWPSVVHKCYRDDRKATAIAAAMLTKNHWNGTYRNKVDLYIALTQFCRDKVITGGLPADKVVVKPNFALDRGMGQGEGDAEGPFALFVGRLDVGKGLEVILGAWSRIKDQSIPFNGKQVPGPRLKILGDGPLAPLIKAAAEKDARIQWLGRRPLEEVYATMGQAGFLIMPSVWYEAMPRTLVEAYSKGTPILASRLGAMAELVDPGRTGLHFTPGDESDLAAQVSAAFADPSHLAGMRKNCRNDFETRYTADENYRLMRKFYDDAIERRHSKLSA